jgi:hypothetical protein
MPTRRDRQARRSRRVLLWAVGLFVVAQLTTSLLLDYCWPLLRFPSARKVLAHLAAEPDKPDIVTLGSSRFEAGIVPTEISSLVSQECRTDRPVRVFNASVPAGDIIAAEFMLHYLLEGGVRPKLVLLEINPETLNHYNDWLGVHVRRQLCWHDMPGYFVQVCQSMQMVRWLGERVNPVYYHREELWQATSEACRSLAAGTATNAPGRAKPALGQQPAWKELLCPPPMALPAEALEQCRSSAFGVVRRWLRHYRISGGNAEALERMLRLCRQKQIEVILLGVPVTTPHREVYTSEINAVYLAYLDCLCQTHGCRFVDYRARVPDSLFVDTHHLGPKGGLFFSRLLTYEVLAPFWRAQQLRQDSRVAQ